MKLPGQATQSCARRRDALRGRARLSKGYVHSPIDFHFNAMRSSALQRSAKPCRAWQRLATQWLN